MHPNRTRPWDARWSAAAEPPPTTALARRQPAGAIARRGIASDLSRAVELADKSSAANTQRAYKADWEDWRLYAESEGLQLFPVTPDALCAYIGHMDSRELSVSTIRRRCSAIAFNHRGARDKGGALLPSPTDDARVRAVMKGLARERGTAQKGKTPVDGEMIGAACRSKQFSLRDKAILAIGYVTGMRRSEEVAIDFSGILRPPDGIVFTIDSSKADQEGKGEVVGLPRNDDDPDVCPVRIFEAWWASMGKPKSGRIFPFSTMTIARIVKRAATFAGRDPSDYSAHSLRAGLATNAAIEGVALQESMKATRHKSADTAVRYVRVSASQNRAHVAAARSLSKRSPTEASSRARSMAKARPTKGRKR